ncbi:MAG TPA: O-antigen ligase family protein [Candidatus Saccharimonadales bacterium]|nr:O-antigen ligase family protein [Candidatus Saccharimonadales bacterium]
MKHQISIYLDSVITFLLLLVAGLTPLFFFNQTTEFYDMPKLIILVVTTVLLFGLWIFSWIIKGKVSITRTPLDIPLLFLLGVIIVSTYFSTSKYASIYGNFPTVHGSAISWVTYILLYFVTVSHLKSIAQIKSFLYTLYGSAVVVALLTFFSFFHVFLPFDFAKGANFTPTGSSFSTIAFLLLLLPLPLFSTLKPNKYLPVPFAVALSILFSVTMVLIGSVPSYIALVIAFLLCLFASKPYQAKKASIGMYLIPVVVTFVTLIFAYLPFPGNKLQELEANFPKEIQLPVAISWKISASAFRDMPFTGTGPATYLFNFTTYKPVEYNLLKFWNFSFDTASNEFLQVLATLGILGLLALASVCVVTLIISWKNLFTNNQEAHQDIAHLLQPALAISGVLSVILLVIHATTLVSIVTTLFILAALMMSQKSIREKVMEFSMGIKASTGDNRQFDLFPIIFFIIFLIAAIPVLYRTVNVVAADHYHRLALQQANKNGTTTYGDLQKAEALNPVIDLYRVDMAQTNFALANALVAQKATGKDAKATTLSTQEKQTIQTLLSQAIDEGRASTVLSPRSSRNYEVLASIYKNITGVAQNALAFSLNSYGQAIQLDPMNPVLRLNVGGIYYSVKNYDLAIRFFTDAANLKPDYTNAYFNLAIAYREKGDLQSAMIAANQLVSLLSDNQNSADYKTASKLLADLKAKVAAGTTAQQNQTQTPSTNSGPTATPSQAESALQNPKLPSVNVAKLNNAPQVTPQPTVKANPNTQLPQAVTSPAPTTTPKK